MITLRDAAVTAERSMKVAVDFSPRIGIGTVFRRVATAETFMRRSATRASWHLHRGLKSTATIGDRSAVGFIREANWD